MATLLWLKAEIWGHVVAGNRGADSGNRKADSLDGALYMSPDFSGAARNVLCRMQKLGITEARWARPVKRDVQPMRLRGTP